ncbi:MAG TPA: hypothetical protein VE689_07535 [Candidatus Udaeobacter sp.]|nr:hypothetical protein [Candidatus Udaeobacter sp.]
MLTIVAAGVVYAAAPSRVTYLEEEGKPVATAVARARQNMQIRQKLRKIQVAVQSRN